MFNMIEDTDEFTIWNRNVVQAATFILLGIFGALIILIT